MGSRTDRELEDPGDEWELGRGPGGIKGQRDIPENKPRVGDPVGQRAGVERRSCSPDRGQPQWTVELSCSR